MAFFGISEREAEASRQKYGLNVRSHRQPFGRNILRGFGGLAVKLLIISALIEAAALMLGLLGYVSSDPAVSAGKIIGRAAAAVICALLGALLRQRADGMLNNAARASCDGIYKVFRGVNGTAEIPASEIAVGDSVFVSKGDVIPADGIVEDGVITVDQSVFGVIGKTDKITAPSGYRHNGLLSTENPYCVYSGTTVCGGSGVIKIAAVGDVTHIAKRYEDKEVSIPEQSFADICKAGGIAGAALAALAVLICAALGAAKGDAALGALNGASVGAIALAAVCLGGKAVACKTCAVSAVKRLESRGVYVSKPENFETAAKTALFMTDKTGVITSGEYVVSGFIDGSGKEYASADDIGGSFGKLLRTAVASVSQAQLLSDGSVAGRNPVDRAMLGFVKNGLKKSSALKKQAEAYEDGLYGVTVTFGGGLVTIFRGEPERLLERCRECQNTDGKRHKITNKNALEKLVAAISLSGKDVEGIAFSNGGIKGGRLPESGVTLIGFMAMQDSYRNDAADEIKRLSDAGVRTMLVTKYSRGNAVFTAKYAGIKRRGSVTLTSEQLSAMSDKELESRLKDIAAVSEATERDKMRLVKAACHAGVKTCLAGAVMEDVPALETADTAFASAAAGTAVRSVCAAAANERGVKCAADFILASRKFAAEYRAWLTFRIILAAAVTAAAIAVGF